MSQHPSTPRAKHAVAETADQPVPVLPLPNDRVPGGVVLASVWMSDDGPEPFAIVMVLHPVAPFYGVYEITWKAGTWEWLLLGEHPNIVPATEAYAQNSGGY